MAMRPSQVFSALDKLTNSEDRVIVYWSFEGKNHTAEYRTAELAIYGADMIFEIDGTVDGIDHFAN
jgi:hypothetical protein